MKQIPVVMPQMGQSVAEGTVVRWCKNVGDDIRADEILLEIETDKTTVELESPATGKLASCLKQEGEVAAAGEVIGVIQAEGEEATMGPPPSAPHAGGREAPPQLVATFSGPADAAPGGALPEIYGDRYSPFVMRLALLNNVTIQELERLQGTGRHGRVTKSDFLQYLARRPLGATSVAALAGRPEVAPDDLASLGQILPMNTLRRTIADHMVQSIHTSAHVTMVHAVDVTHVAALRSRIKAGFFRKYRAKLTYTVVLLFVTSRVLRDYPKMNASIYGTNVILRKDINIGCAVALADETLVVPVVRSADRKSFPEIAQEVDRLIGLARKQQLTRADVDHGTFTLSNFGTFGSLMGTPIINQPQVAILGMGAVFKAPVVVDGQIGVRDQIYLSFSFDHRIIDGELGGRFLRAIEKATAALTEEALSLTTL